ncbi:hypothetical protein CEUSTIGMA_g11162.t1 [Chlamydomonas eustigma]|uniref:Amine oxidase domain-containing protein n=1 Tax=Chlamydomonas eustigma TaxID=1157962 RepID=A0A250XKY8_9CHLO|nr:hypothetical protein CEUSTIGMA_g11162.t1 [Chlamydomonas eustigma]|eukprot:GAX83737.1 hypothetical protein CEUSTIGMA_g11162.t1 [Chlamydomonas eustigma]
MEASDHLGGRSQRQLFSPPAANAPLWVDQGGMWVGPSQTSFLALLKEYDLPLYVSYHGVGNELLKWKDQRLYKEGTCWDCVIFPRNGESEIPGPMEEAVHDTKGEMKAGLRELVLVMKLFRKVVDTIDVEKPWTSPNANSG